MMIIKSLDDYSHVRETKYNRQIDEMILKFGIKFDLIGVKQIKVVQLQYNKNKTKKKWK